MNANQRRIIVDAYVQHLDNGNRSDIAGAYIDIKEFFTEIIKSDEKLKLESEEAYEEWVSS